MTKYLIRLDDACPYMDRKKWQRMEDLLEKYNIKPLVGIIPANADSQTMMESEDGLFWDKAHLWEHKGWSVALHGYDHICISEGGLNGINPMWCRSEFAGLPLERQCEKIRMGYTVMKEHGFEPLFFFAPSHTFDENTILALRQETNIRKISDTIGRYPYRKDDFIYIPQIAGHCVEMPISGIYTFCFHPNTMNDNSFLSLETFLKNHKHQFESFDNLDLKSLGEKQIIDKLLSCFFFAYRRIRNLK